jgi:hypothetical protein
MGCDPLLEELETSARESPSPTIWTKSRLWVRLDDIAHANIERDLPLLQENFSGLCREIASKCFPISDTWAPRVTKLLQCSYRNKVSDPELAWRFAKSAERSLLFAEESLNPGEADGSGLQLAERSRREGQELAGQSDQTSA